MPRTTSWTKKISRNDAPAGERQTLSSPTCALFRALACPSDLATLSFSVAC